MLWSIVLFQAHLQIWWKSDHQLPQNWSAHFWFFWLQFKQSLLHSFRIPAAKYNATTDSRHSFNNRQQLSINAIPRKAKEHLPKARSPTQTNSSVGMFREFLLPIREAIEPMLYARCSLLWFFPHRTIIRSLALGGSENGPRTCRIHIRCTLVRHQSNGAP